MLLHISVFPFARQGRSILSFL